jgi:hypothetical protein
VLALLVGLGATGFLGVGSGTVTAAGDGTTLTVTHPRVVRAGLAVPFHVDVRRPVPSEDPVRLAVSAALLERFDFQNFYPNPAAETSSRNEVFFDFDPPPGKRFRLSLDARTAPDQNGSTQRYSVRLLSQGGGTVAAVDFRLWVVP